MSMNAMREENNRIAKFSVVIHDSVLVYQNRKKEGKPTAKILNGEYKLYKHTHYR